MYVFGPLIDEHRQYPNDISIHVNMGMEKVLVLMDM